MEPGVYMYVLLGRKLVVRKQKLGMCMPHVSRV